MNTGIRDGAVFTGWVFWPGFLTSYVIYSFTKALLQVIQIPVGTVTNDCMSVFQG